MMDEVPGTGTLETLPRAASTYRRLPSTRDAHTTPFQVLQESHLLLECQDVTELLTDCKDLHFVGEGAFGLVLCGHWQGSPAAFKLVRINGLSSVATREAVLSRSLAHPNVVNTFTTRVACVTEDSLDRILRQQQEQQEQVVKSHPAGLVRSNQQLPDSCEGFGSPFSPFSAPGRRSQCAPSLADTMACLKAKPGSHILLQVMEFCDMGSLNGLITKDAFLPSKSINSRVALRTLLRTALEIARGMSHLHANDVVHLDLKPCNVLVKSSSVDRRGFIVKVADFGLSRVVATGAHTNSWGTLTYMAPEHMLGGNISKAIDVYAFGLILWEMACGTRPFAGCSQARLMIGVTQRGLRPEWPTDQPCLASLAAVSQRCWAQRPEERPTFVEVIARLQQLDEDLRKDLQQRLSEDVPRSSAVPQELKAHTVSW